MINTTTLIQLIQVHAARYKLHGSTQLRFTMDAQETEARIHEIATLLQHLSKEQ